MIPISVTNIALKTRVIDRLKQASANLVSVLDTGETMPRTLLTRQAQGVCEPCSWQACLHRVHVNLNGLHRAVRWSRGLCASLRASACYRLPRVFRRHACHRSDPCTGYPSPPIQKQTRERTRSLSQNDPGQPVRSSLVPTRQMPHNGGTQP